MLFLFISGLECHLNVTVLVSFTRQFKLQLHITKQITNVANSISNTLNIES